jgi:hypothetical protein
MRWASEKFLHAEMQRRYEAGELGGACGVAAGVGPALTYFLWKKCWGPDVQYLGPDGHPGVLLACLPNLEGSVTYFPPVSRETGEEWLLPKAGTESEDLGLEAVDK